MLNKELEKRIPYDEAEDFLLDVVNEMLCEKYDINDIKLKQNSLNSHIATFAKKNISTNKIEF